tara:strand:- start:1591 stop:2037 length:447 start_codon:yes stop_codon:yes gene_type:complete
MDIRKVKKLIEMLEASELEEIEIQEGEESVRLVKKQSHSVISDVSSTNENLTSIKSPTDHETPPKESVETEGDTITSPMVGTFYAAASPGAKPFVSIGDEIMEGDVVCIVEAMKMMNEIKSDFSGIVTAILVENSEPVEFGQSLFRIA